MVNKYNKNAPFEIPVHNSFQMEIFNSRRQFGKPETKGFLREKGIFTIQMKM